jgi:phage terminase large subunit GpA-like protein
MRFYNACSDCGNEDIILVEDTEGEMAEYSVPGMMFTLCTKCGKHTRPENWNRCNEVDTSPHVG